jgi:GST-like protein
MTYVLYGDRGSGSAMVEMALAEAGQAVELRRVPLEGDHQLRAAYRAINPMGRLPTLLLPDGTVQTEHLAILLTLADRHPDAGLLPAPGDPARARALRWMALMASEFYPLVTIWDYPARYTSDAAAEPGVRDRAVAQARDVLRVVEEHAGLCGAGPEPFLLGSRFCLADIPLAVMPRWMGGRVWTPANCARLEALAQAVAARPAIAPIWRHHRLAGD